MVGGNAKLTENINQFVGKLEWIVVHYKQTNITGVLSMWDSGLCGFAQTLIGKEYEKAK